MMGGWGMGFGGFGFLWMAIFWIVILAVVFWFLGSLFPRSNTAQPPTKTNESPLDIVKQRYARGEISRAEYETLLHDLEASRTAGSAS